MRFRYLLYCSLLCVLGWPTGVRAQKRAPLFTAEQLPEFPGGPQALIQQIDSQVRYPLTAWEQKLEGNVYVRFVVDTAGLVTNPTIIKGLGGGCDEEALRVVEALPRFRPGRQHGRPVAVYQSLPVRFVRLTTLPPLAAADQSSGTVYDQVEQPPQFPGGEAALQRFLAEQVRYPREAKRLRRQGTVRLRLTIDFAGFVQKIAVVESLGAGCDEEALRVARLLPVFTPARQHGQPVSAHHVIGVEFRLPPAQAPPAPAPPRVGSRPVGYPGGVPKLFDNIYRLTHYPREARRAGIVGRVTIQLQIDSTGRAHHPTVIDSLGYGCNEEALRVAAALPAHFEPALDARGRPTATAVQFPVFFPPESIKRYYVSQHTRELPSHLLRLFVPVLSPVGY